jgi:hypothetical protein
MLKRTFFAASIIFFTTISVHAQSQYSYYFDRNLNLVTRPAKAIFLGTGAYQNGLFELEIFDKRSKKLLILEHFTDSSLQVSEGLFVSFLPNGNKSEEGNYLKGKKDGLWKRWWQKGNIIDSSLFNNGEKILQANFSYYPNGKLFELTMYNFKEGRKVVAYYDEEGNPLPPLTAKNKEDPNIVFTKVESPPTFPGGIDSWNHYISDILQQHNNDLRKSNESGTCVLRFIVKADGSISQIEAVKMKGTKLAEIAANAIKNGPKWIPGRQNGHKVSAIVLQSVEFAPAQ